jgi:hypothetical protein
MAYPALAECSGGFDAFAGLVRDVQFVTDVATLQQFGDGPPAALASLLVCIGVQDDMPDVVFDSYIRHISEDNSAAKLQKNSIFAPQFGKLTDSLRFVFIGLIK